MRDYAKSDEDINKHRVYAKSDEDINEHRVYCEYQFQIDKGDDCNEDEEEEGEEEEEEEEEEDRPAPRQEVLDYLQMRQKLKDAIRQKADKDNGSCLSNRQDRKQSSQLDKFGSFFGSSHLLIADRVIAESKAFSETQQVLPKVASNRKDGRKCIVNPANTKSPKLKDTRDYSFLISDEAGFPEPAKVLLVETNLDVQASQLPSMRNQPSISRARFLNQSKEGSLLSKNSHNQEKGAEKPFQSNNKASSSKSSKPVMSKNPYAKNASCPMQKLVCVHKKESVSGVKRMRPNGKQTFQQGQILDRFKGKKLPKKTLSSCKPEMMMRLKHIPSQHCQEGQSYMKIRDTIREMFRGYDPSKFVDDDDDISNMEADFKTIQKEEKRSARLGRKEDQEELKLIQQEEEMERRRKAMKRR